MLALAPGFDFSVGLGLLLGRGATIYFQVFGLLWPRTALLPALAVGMGVAGIGLAYPAIAGATGRFRSGLALAAIGGACLGTLQLLTGSSPLDYLGMANNYDLAGKLAGEYKPWVVLKAFREPLEAQPILLVQPLIWLAASLPAAMLLRRRQLFLDLLGLALANAVISGAYFALPAPFPITAWPRAPVL